MPRKQPGNLYQPRLEENVKLAIREMLSEGSEVGANTIRAWLSTKFIEENDDGLYRRVLDVIHNLQAEKSITVECRPGQIKHMNVYFITSIT